MLNPESVDSKFVDCEKVFDILFSDENADEVLTIRLSRENARSLADMIQSATKKEKENKCTMKYVDNTLKFLKNNRPHY